MKVLIFYASYGGGHFATANAMKEEIEKDYKENEVVMVDCMKYLSKSINYITVKSYEEMAKKMPKAWGHIYKASRKGIISKISSGANKILAIKLEKLIKEINPGIIISAHPFSNQMCATLKKHNKIFMPVYSILTDFKYHEQWLVNHKYIDTFFVSNEKMKNDLIKYGLDEKKVICVRNAYISKIF